MARVTVCLAVFNGAPTLAVALESVAGQSYRDFDILILDDGSTDGSVEVARRYTDRILCQPNQGLGAARKRMVEEADGELFAFIDHDDWWVPDKLEKQVELLDRSGAAMVHSDCWYHYEDGSIVDRDLSIGDDSDPLDHILPNNQVVASSALFRRDAMLEAGSFVADTVRCSDWYGWFMLAARYRFAHLPEKQLHYFVQESSLANVGYRFYSAQHYLLEWKILPRFDELFARLPSAERAEYKRLAMRTLGTAASGMAKYMDQMGHKAAARELHREAISHAGLKSKVVMRAIRSYLTPARGR